jgi:hydroxyacyl-ACP dehydratase HTD2-like protein with hotdog domain
VPVTDEIVCQVSNRIGASAEPLRVVIDRLTSQRYARAIGETDPLYFDAEAAHAAGFADVVVPPNFLPSYLDWTDGGGEETLRPDGTPRGEMAWLPTEGVRIMGAGEDMVFHRPLVAGTEVVMNSTLTDVKGKETRSGLMLIIKVRNSYATDDGALIMTCTRTILGR